MPEYKLEVTTGEKEGAGTLDHIYIILCGSDGQSEWTELDNFGIDFRPGKTCSYKIKTESSLGKLLLVKVDKDPHLILPENEWYCSKIMVTTPEGDAILFPCFRWVSSGEHVELRGGKAMKAFEDNHPMLIQHREHELALTKSTYEWLTSDDGFPHFIDSSAAKLPSELHFSECKSAELDHAKIIMGLELMLKGMIGSTEKWESIEDMKGILHFKTSDILEYVEEHWKDDDFFGYQFLNGVNPNVIKRCTELPLNFPVTEEMVSPFLEDGSSLTEEMQKGNIFLCDQRRLDGITPRMYDGERLHVAASLCLFYVNTEKNLMPIAMQLHQQPSEENPIFLPSDSETDWLLAKMFIKNSDYMEHQSFHHLLNTHFLAEVFSVATLRCLPVIHPVYKLLIPHFRYTLYINTVGRAVLNGPSGPFETSSLGLEGINELMRRAHAETTYASLCLPENITARGLESIPNFYYRDDGLKLWNIINSFVKAVVEYYYPSDNEVLKDSELQDWISEIFNHGFLGKKSSGIPDSFNSVKEVIKFITMVIFTVTGQHAAVNTGQYDYQSFMPNGSLLLRKPPPTTKGQTSMATILDTLPNVDETVKFVARARLLSDKYTDVLPLGAYPEERFDEPAPKQMIKEFQAELSFLSEEIKTRNSQLRLPYTYLDPTEVENSITI